MSWSMTVRGPTKSEVLKRFAVEVGTNPHTPKDGRLEGMVAAGMATFPEVPKAPWVYYASSNGHVEPPSTGSYSGTSYQTVTVGEAAA